MLKFDAQRAAYRDFADLLDTDLYQPLPDDWFVGITDVIDSTSAIASGRYKDVNYAGASAIAALGNAWSSFDFPFVFRGDGAAFAVHPDLLASATISATAIGGIRPRHPPTWPARGTCLGEGNTGTWKRCEDGPVCGIRRCHLCDVRRRGTELG
jgi:hypothetical protein